MQMVSRCTKYSALEANLVPFIVVIGLSTSFIPRSVWCSKFGHTITDLIHLLFGFLGGLQFSVLIDNAATELLAEANGNISQTDS